MNTNWYPVNRIPVTIKDDGFGRKAGAEGFSFWTSYQDVPYYKDHPNGFMGDQAIILGPTSTDLCCLDFDDHEKIGSNKFEEFKSLISPSILEKMSVEETSNNGVHAYFRSEVLNKKRVLARSEDKSNTIELLAGKGCLVFCNYNGSRYYKKISEREIEQAEYLTDEETVELIKVCEKINQYVDVKETLKLSAPVKKPNGCVTMIGDSGSSQADILRGSEGYSWLQSILYNQGWYEIGERTSSDGRNYVAYSHPNASNPNRPSISLFEDSGVFVHSTDEKKNMGLVGGENYSIYSTILTIEFDGDTKAMSRAFYERFPQYHNRLAHLSVDQLSIFDDLFDDNDVVEDEDETEETNTYAEKDALVRDVIADKDYAVLASHINCAMQNSAYRMPFGYLLSGLVLTGGCAYRGFYDYVCRNRPKDDDFPHADTTLGVTLTAPSGSGKNNVLGSFRCYAEKIREYGKGRAEGKKQFETAIAQLPATQRAIQASYLTGVKNAMFYQDEYQDVLSVKRTGDQQKLNLHSFIKMLINKNDKVYEIDNSQSFGKEIKELEKDYGELDMDWWRMSQFCVGTPAVYSSLSHEDEEGGFARRYLWFNERKIENVFVSPEEVSNHVVPDPSFLDFLKSLLSIRENGTERLGYPIVCIRWEPEAIEAVKDRKLNWNDVVIRDNSFSNCPLRNSYEDYIYRLAKIFAIIRGEWINYSGDCVETVGDDVQIGVGASSVGNPEIKIKVKDVEFAHRIFEIACKDFCYGCNSAITVSNEERNSSRLENLILSFVKKRKSATARTVLKQFPGHTIKSITSVLDSYVSSGELMHPVEWGQKYYSKAGYKKELEQRKKEKDEQ